MNAEERKEFDELKRRVDFLEELCANYHNVLVKMQKGDHDPFRRKILAHDSDDRDLVLLHNSEFTKYMRNGNMGFERNVG
jgi:hypothetical protein